MPQQLSHSLNEHTPINVEPHFHCLHTRTTPVMLLKWLHSEIQLIYWIDRKHLKPLLFNELAQQQKTKAMFATLSIVPTSTISH